MKSYTSPGVESSMPVDPNDSTHLPDYPTIPARALLMVAILLVTGIFVVTSGPTTPPFGNGVPQTITYCAAFPEDFTDNQTHHALVHGRGSGYLSRDAQAPMAFPLGLVNETNWTSGPWTCYGYTVNYVDAGLTIGHIGIEVKTFDCAPASGVSAINLLGRGGKVTATENLSSSDWGSTSQVVPVVGDTIVISAVNALTQDELVLNSTMAQESFPIVNSGAWSGCSY